MLSINTDPENIRYNPVSSNILRIEIEKIYCILGVKLNIPVVFRIISHVMFAIY